MGADILSILSSTIKVTWVISLIFIYILVMYVKTLSAISKRTWRGGWTTLGLFFLPFIMFPVVALKYKKEENKEEEK
jgi:type III secretory pathway component EscU